MAAGRALRDPRGLRGRRLPTTRAGYADRRVSDVLFSIGEVSRRTGVSVDVIRVWERRYGLVAPQRSPANFRLYSAADIGRLRLMRLYSEQNMPRWRAAELVRRTASTTMDRNPGIGASDVDRALGVLRAGFERFDAAAADRLLRGLAGVYPTGVILRDLVLPYLCEVGARWECGETTVAHEHFASSFLEGWMLAMARGWTRGGSRRAVLACLPAEQHVLGLIAFGIALRDLDWNVTFLGRDTPLDDARESARVTGADALVLTASLAGSLHRVAEPIVACAREQRVRIGGRALEHGVPDVLAEHVLPGDLLAAAQRLTEEVPEPRAAHAAAGGADQAAPAGARGARAGGSGTASTSSGAE